MTGTMDGQTTNHDVIILGGGLAGLTLALQLHDRLPELDIVVLERATHPLPLAAHKVGESTVDVGAHYFGETLGLLAIAGMAITVLSVALAAGR